jgi:hypothetical protein
MTMPASDEFQHALHQVLADVADEDWQSAECAAIEGLSRIRYRLDKHGDSDE